MATQTEPNKFKRGDVVSVRTGGLAFLAVFVANRDEADAIEVLGPSGNTWVNPQRVDVQPCHWLEDALAFNNWSKP